MSRRPKSAVLWDSVPDEQRLSVMLLRAMGRPSSQDVLAQTGQCRGAERAPKWDRHGYLKWRWRGLYAPCRGTPVRDGLCASHAALRLRVPRELDPFERHEIWALLHPEEAAARKAALAEQRQRAKERVKQTKAARAAAAAEDRLRLPPFGAAAAFVNGGIYFVAVLRQIRDQLALRMAPAREPAQQPDEVVLQDWEGGWVAA